MKTLIDIFNKIKFGDIVLFQKIDEKGVYQKPKLVTIVGIDVWDMAAAVYYVDYNEFNKLRYDTGTPEPEVKGFGEWMEYWNILGHWQKMPDFRDLIGAYREQVYPKQGEQVIPD